MSNQRIFAAVVLAVLSVAASAAGQGRHESPLRTVRGTVVDKQETPLSTAVVYLKNLRTLTVRTHISDDNGHYKFSGLDPNVDYEIHAEHDDLTSATRTISSFVSRKEIVLQLKVDKKKGGK